MHTSMAFMKLELGDMVSPYTLTDGMLGIVEETEALADALWEDAGRFTIGALRERNIVSAQASASIEGNPLTLEQVRAVARGLPVEALERHVREAANTYECYCLAADAETRSLGDLVDMHGVMMRGLHGSAGRIRDGNVCVVGAEGVVHTAPDASQVHRQLMELFTWMCESDEHPLVRSCVFHYEFERIHPFFDGNGRMGRLWHAALLSEWNRGMDPVPFEALVRRRRNGYYRALRVSGDRGDSTAFLEYMLETIRDAAAGTLAGTSRGTLRDRRAFRRPARRGPAPPFEERLPVRVDDVLLGLHVDVWDDDPGELARGEEDRHLPRPPPPDRRGRRGGRPHRGRPS